MAKAYTDIEQSRKLAKILPIETADFCWGIDDDTLRYNCHPWTTPWVTHTARQFYLPCWSLAGLIKALPKKPCREYNLVISEEPLYFAFDDLEINIHKDYDGADCVDACVNMILQLHDKGLL